MKYVLMPLTELESSVGNYCGIAYADKHRDRWVDIQAAEECLVTYDRFSTFVVVEGVVYQVVKDYVIIDENLRLYIGKQSNIVADDMGPETTPAPKPTEPADPDTSLT